jgi:DNA polymerase/3'-5' exonuclease PolX
MSQGRAMTLVEAVAAAEGLRDRFGLAAEEWQVCGSVRRCRSECRDIDHVVIGREGEVRIPGVMFPSTGNVLLHELDVALEAGEVQAALYGDDRRTRWGPKRRGLVYEGVKHELWVVTRAGLGPALAIATGPAEYSRMLVTQLASRGIYQQGGVSGLEGLVIDQRTHAVRPCPTEEEYFGLCGVVWTPPAERRAE